jgi:hypothetical protein
MLTSTRSWLQGNKHVLATRMNKVVVVKLSQGKSTNGNENESVSLVRITSIITTKNRPADCILSLFR